MCVLRNPHRTTHFLACGDLIFQQKIHVYFVQVFKFLSIPKLPDGFILVRMTSLYSFFYFLLQPLEDFYILALEFFFVTGEQACSRFILK